MAHLLPVSAAARVQREFGPRFGDLSEEAATDMIEMHLGRQVREGAVYIVNLLPQLPNAMPQPPQTPTRRQQPQQPQQHQAGSTGASPAKVLQLVEGEGPVTQPTHLQLPVSPLAVDELSHTGFGVPTSAAVVAAPGDGGGVAAPAAADAIVAAAAVAAAAVVAVAPAAAVQQQPRGAALLFSALLVADCGRGVAELVRHLLTCAEAASDDPMSVDAAPDTQSGSSAGARGGAGTGDGTGDGTGSSASHTHLANGVGSGMSNGHLNSGGEGSAALVRSGSGPLRGGCGGGGTARPSLDGVAVRELLHAVLCLGGGFPAGRPDILAAAHRQQLRPLLHAIVGELQAYEFYRAVKSSGSVPLGAVYQAPPYALRGLVLTAEQRAVIEMVRSRGGEPLVTSVQAFAGTAKTTTARAVVASLRSKRVLYLVYNKAMQEEAKEAMAADRQAHGGWENFKVMTTHGLAYWQYGFPEHFDSGKRIGDMSAADVRKFLEALWAPVPRKAVRAVITAAVRTAVRRYMASPDEELHIGHFSRQAREKAVEPMQRLLAGKGQPNASAEVVFCRLVDAAQRLWTEMTSAQARAPVPHNGYLKLWALEKPVLDRWDLIIVDEAQDVNGVTKQLILELQENTHVLLLGDKHQQIYSFNFACGLLARPETIPRRGPTLSLRQTFRFGPEIAAAVNAILKEAYGEPEYMIGCEGQQGVVYCCLPDDRDLTDVTAEDLANDPLHGPGAYVDPIFGFGAGGAAGGGPVAAPRPRRFRFLQCPLRGLAPSSAFPPELRMTSPNPRVGVAILPAEVFPRLRPRVTVVARRNSTLVQLALLLVAAGHAVCASFQENRDSGPADDPEGEGEAEEGSQAHAGGGGAAAAEGATAHGAAGSGGRDAFHGGGRRPRMPPILRRMIDIFEFLHRGRRFGGSHVMADLDSAEDLAELVDARTDADLCSAAELVHTLLAEQPTCEIPEMVQNLTHKLIPDQSRADYYLTTAHKMKGRQHHVIQLADDFVELAPTDDEGRKELQRCRESYGGIDELNAVYVAASRARSVLLLNRDLSRLMLRLHEQQAQLRAPSLLRPARSGPPSTTQAVSEPLTPPHQLRLALSAPPNAIASTTTDVLATADGSAGGTDGHAAGWSAHAAASAAPATPLPALLSAPPAHEVQPFLSTPPEAPGTADDPCFAGGAGALVVSRTTSDSPLGDARAAAAGPSAGAAPGVSCATSTVGSPLCRRIRSLTCKDTDADGEAPLSCIGGSGGPTGADDSPRPAKIARKSERAAPAAGELAGIGAGGPAGAAPTALQVKCPMCRCRMAAGASGAAGAEEGGGWRPAVVWRCRPLCDRCARGTVFGQVVELAAAAPGEAAVRPGGGC